MSTDTLAERIAEMRERIAELDKQRVTAVTRLQAFEEAMSLVSGGDGGAAIRSENTHFQRGPGRPRRADANVIFWADVIGDLPSSPSVFGYAELEAAADNHGMNITRAALRTRMMTLVSDGLLERVRDGVFRRPENKTASLEREAAVT